MMVPPHWSLYVRLLANETFPNRWIGGDGPFLSSWHSADINLLHFFPEGNVKGHSLLNKGHDITDLEQKIRECSLPFLCVIKASKRVY